MRLWWGWLAGNPRNKMELIYSYIYIYVYTARKSSNFDLFFFTTCPSIFWWCMNTFDCYHGHIRSSNVFFPALKHMVVLWFLKSHPFLHPQETLPFSGGLYISEMALAGPLLCNFRNLSELSLLMGERVDNICPLISNPFQKPWSM